MHSSGFPSVCMSPYLALLRPTLGSVPQGSSGGGCFQGRRSILFLLADGPLLLEAFSQRPCQSMGPRGQRSYPVEYLPSGASLGSDVTLSLYMFGEGGISPWELLSGRVLPCPFISSGGRLFVGHSRALFSLVPSSNGSCRWVDQ
jgi:hypothetical protein